MGHCDGELLRHKHKRASVRCNYLAPVQGLFWKYAEVSGNPRWKGMTWGMLPSLGSAMCACTWHFFYNAPSLEALVALQVGAKHERVLSCGVENGQQRCSSSRLNTHSLSTCRQA